MQTIGRQVQAEASAILQNPSNLNVLMNTSLIDLSFIEIERALMFRDQVLSNDKKLGRSGSGAQAQLKLAISRMADGAAIYATILNRLWKEAQANIPSGQISVGDPAFIQDDFSGTLHFSEVKRMTRIDADDCEL